VSKNTSETDNFPHGTKSLLTSVIKQTCFQFPYFETIILPVS